jgi:chloramphenicol 3-O phosphotransferase
VSSERVSRWEGPPGRVLLLNGTSSSGKTSIARELLTLLDPPHFHCDVDAFNGMRAKEKTLKLSHDELQVVLRQTRAGFHRAVAGMAAAGNSVVMDYVMSEPWRLADCIDVFSEIRVVYVGIRCDADETDRREALRGDRPQGLARSQMAAVHRVDDYDIEVRSDRMTPREAARHIVDRLPELGASTAFDRLRSGSWPSSRDASGRD